MSSKPTANSHSRRAWLGTVGGLASGASAMAPLPASAKLVYFPEKGVEGVAKRVRKMAPLLDDLQGDLAGEEWDYIVEYPAELRSFVPAFTKYTDAAFPDDTEIDKNLRVAMRYEVGKLFNGVKRLEAASKKQDIKEAQAAFADISLAFDRYLKSGNLYEGDASAVKGDATTDVPKLKKVGAKAKAEVKPAPSAPKTEKPAGTYSNSGSAAARAPRKAREEVAAPAPAARPVVSYTLDEKPSVGDAVVVLEGYESGKTGTLLGVSKDSSVPSGIVKTNDVVRGFREILVLPLDRIAKQTDAPADAALSK